MDQFMKDKIKHLSVSSITTYQTCPKMYYYQYILQAMGLPSKALDVGKHVHKGIELFNEGKNWEEILKKEILSPMNQENVDVFRIVRRIVKAYERNPVEGKTLHNEFECKMELENSKGEKIPIPFLGYIDRIIDRGIVEYKTSSEDYNQDKIDTSLQATIYAYFFYKLYKEYPKDIIYWVANKNKAMKEDEYLPQIMITCRNQQDVDNAFEEIKQVYESIMQEQFEPKTGDQCFWCSFRNICKARNNNLTK